MKTSERDNDLRERLEDGVRRMDSLLAAGSYAEPREAERIRSDLKGLREEAVQKISGIRALLGLTPKPLRSLCGDLIGRYDRLVDSMHEHNRRLSSEQTASVRELVCPVDGKMLDDQQLSAIAMDVDTRLVIAGAGTGKTSTVTGLAKHLVMSGKASPDEILFLSFTNSAVSEMSKRMRGELGVRCDVTTFHRLGLRILASCDGVTPRVSRVDQLDFVHGYVKSHLSDRMYARSVVEHIAFEGRHAEDESDFGNRGDYQRFLAEDPLVTIKGDRVKSHGEAEIADILYMDGIDYVYEDDYEVDTRDGSHGQYHPDFHISGTSIYIEYFGIDRRGNVAPFMRDEGGSEAYNASIEWKTETHRRNGTVLIPLYAYQHWDGNLKDVLEDALRENGVEPSPRDPNGLIWSITGDSDRAVKELSSQLSMALSLIKGTGLPWEEAYPQGRTLRERLSLKRFGSLLEPIYDAYQERLSSKGEIDFEDMLNLASDRIRGGLWTHGYRYVVVDEYQDISRSRMRLLQEMRGSKDYKLFCVGDDWQSIFRFSGSDVGYILDFERFWGPSETCRLERTYRFSGEVLRMSSAFMNSSGRQLKKNLVGMGHEADVRFIRGSSASECTSKMLESLDSIPEGDSVLMLGRFRHDISSLDDPRVSWDSDLSNGYYRVRYTGRADLDIRCMTIHGSKGLEADHVFILNNKKGKFGFPEARPQPPVIGRLLNDCGDSMDEERRLMYVAMTRARRSLSFVVLDGQESVFMKEMMKPEPTELRCPLCGGMLVRRHGRYGEFYGCSNYGKGCRYTRQKKRALCTCVRDRPLK